MRSTIYPVARWWSTLLVGLIMVSAWPHPWAMAGIAGLHVVRHLLNEAHLRTQHVQMDPLMGLVNLGTGIAVGHLAGWTIPALLYLPWMALMLGTFGGSSAIPAVAALVVLAVGDGWVDGAALLPMLTAAVVAVAVFHAAHARAEQLEAATRETRSHLAEVQRLHEAMLQQEKIASLGLLAAGIAHEINNPMGWVTSNLQTLRDDLANGAPSPRVVAEWRDEVVPETLDGVKRINAIVADLRRFGRSSPESTTRFDIDEEVARAVRLCERKHPEGVGVDVDLRARAAMEGRPEQIVQLLVNLLINAGQAMEARGGRIFVSTSRDADEVIVRVADQGTGVADTVRGRMFEPFVTTKAPGKGTGLGLAVARDIVTSHGGVIECESMIGLGATFTVRLPVEAV